MKESAAVHAEQIYHKYKNMIFKISLEILQEKSMAEDAAQETACKIIKYSDRLREFSDAEERNYIAAIARNTAITLSNKRNRDESYPESEYIPDRNIESNPSEYVITNESVNAIVAELKKLDEKYSEPLLLQKLGHYSIKDISDVLGAPERTVKYRIHRAKQILKDKLKNIDEKN